MPNIQTNSQAKQTDILKNNRANEQTNMQTKRHASNKTE